MNGASTLGLALAVHNAGAFPSISSYCYTDNQLLIDDLAAYTKLTNSAELLLALDWNTLLDPRVFKAINQLKISHITFMSDPIYDEYRKKKAAHLSSYLNCKRVKIIFSADEVEPGVALLLKGSEGAGRPGTLSTNKFFLSLKGLDAPLVPMGGIATAEQVRYYITNGAAMVSVGTAFAAAKESVLSDATKQAIVAATKDNISAIDNNLNQNSLVFSKLDIEDDDNNTQSLLQGIKGNTAGHIFAGYGVEHINEIKSVSDIVMELINEL